MNISKLKNQPVSKYLRYKIGMCICLLSFPFFLFSSSNLVLNTNPDSIIELREFAEFFTDENCHVQITSIENLYKNKYFSKTEPAVTFPGRYCHLIYFSVQNTSKDTLQTLFQLSYQDSIIVYQNNNQHWKKYPVFGKRNTAQVKNEFTLTPLRNQVHLKIPPGTNRFFVRAKSNFGITQESENYFNPIFISPQHRVFKFEKKWFISNIGVLLFPTVFLFTIIFCLIQYLQIREEAYLYYSLYNVAMLLFFIRELDYISESYNLISPIFLSQFWYAMLLMFLYISYVLFIQNFLQESINQKTIGKTINHIIISLLLVFLINFTILYFSPWYSWIFLTLIKLAFLLTAGCVLIILYRERNRLINYIIMGSLCLIGGVLLTLLIPKPASIDFMDYSHIPGLIGTMLENFLFITALSYKTRLTVSENEKLRQQIKLLQTPKTQEKTKTQSTFMQSLNKILKENLTNPDLDIDFLCKKLHISRSQLHRNIKKETELSASMYINYIRLQTAKQMLTDSKQSIKEIAYSVGFSSPSYFSKMYRRFFGSSPQDLRQ